jgi:hypothetical protein
MAITILRGSRIREEDGYSQFRMRGEQKQFLICTIGA